MACSNIKSGTDEYMSLYPKTSADGAIRLGNIVPDFSAETTHGPIKSFHEWKAGKWCVLFSHPADFTPVCTTEIASLCKEHYRFKELDCLIATLSVDSLETHDKWMKDIEAQNEDGPISIDFPIMADTNRDIAGVYGMLDPYGEHVDLPLTVRCVFIITPENKLMLSLNYPACVGRNTEEIVRCVKALQLSYQKSIATPANWPNNHAKVTLPDGSVTEEYKGSVFLLPTISEKDAAEHYPGYHTCDIPSKMPYLRLVKPADVGMIPLDNVSGQASCTSGKKKRTTDSKGTKVAAAPPKKEKSSFSWFRRSSNSTDKANIAQ